MRGIVDGAGVGPVGARGRRGRAGARPHPVLRRGRRPARRPGRDRARQRRARRRCSTCSRRSPAWSCTRPRCSPARSRSGEHGAGAGRHRAAQVDQPRAHRDAHGAQGVPRGARRHRDPGRLGERARPVPVRLLRDRRGAARPRWPTSRRGSTTWCSPTSAVHAEIMTQDEARKSGAMALFGEKYGDEVRVISVGDWARELCGGTHAGRSGQLGVIKLLGESSIGSGVRRVEALVGGDAYRFLAREHVLVAQLSEALKARPEELPERVNDLVERLRTAEKEIERVRVQQLLAAAGRARRRRPRTSTASRSSATAPTARARATCASSRSTSAAGCRRARPGVVAIIGSSNGKPAVVVAVNDEARALGPLGERAGQGGGDRARRQRRRQGRRRAGRRRRRDATPTRRWSTSSTRSAARPPSAEAGRRATRGPARRRRRRRAHRRRPLRPVRADRHAGGDRRARARATWPGCAR